MSGQAWRKTYATPTHDRPKVQGKSGRWISLRFGPHDTADCYYCGRWITKEIATIDHVLPRSRGGRRSNNIVLSCLDCNFLKKDMTREEFLVYAQEMARSAPSQSHWHRIVVHALGIGEP